MRHHDQHPFNWPFDADNRAWQRFLTLAHDHLDALVWTDDDGQPAAVTLIDPASDDAVTLAPVDSHQDNNTYVLLALTTAGDLTCHGPFTAATAATDHGATLALSDTTIAATGPARLQHPDQPALTDDAWQPIPTHLADTARPGPLQAPTTALIMLDRAGHRVAAVGPFTTPDAATTWHPHPGPGVDRLVVALHPTTEGKDLA